MIPVKQRYLHDPEKGILGDCYSACVASILHLPIEQVPCAQEAGITEVDEDAFNLLFNKYFEGRGLAELCFMAHEVHEQARNVHHVITGPSPRFPGFLHSVVGKGGKIVYDPHPDGTGLVGDPETEWYFTYFVIR